MNLNIPTVRQQELGKRLADGLQISAIEIAREFDISLDTARRDLIALENAGMAQRVRGGAIPVSVPAPSMQTKIADGKVPSRALISTALKTISHQETLLLDGGSTVLALATALTPRDGLSVITPSPFVAIECLKKGIETLMIGGRLSSWGGINVGVQSSDMLRDVLVNVAILGACGIDPEFGMSSDDFDEAQTKKQMSKCASETLILTDSSKLNMRARHRVLPSDQIDIIVTNGPPLEADIYKAHGIEMIYAPN